MTRTLFRSFDENTAGIVGKIPSSFEGPFRWLGRYTTPVLWAGYIALIHLTLLTPGRLDLDSMLLIVTFGLGSVIKLFIRRKRPPTIYAQSMKIKSYSFPSSHAYAGLLGGGYLAFTAFDQSQIALGMGIGLFAITIGISRIRIGAHYPTDVVGGWLLALIVLKLVV